MKLEIILNDQLKENIDNLASLIVDAEEFGIIEILSGHSDAFFIARQNSEIILKFSNNEIKKFFLEKGALIEMRQKCNMISLITSAI